MQTGLHEQSNVQMTQHTSSLKQVFFQNSIIGHIGQDFANPAVADHMQFYPEDVGTGSISEVWQAQHWKRMPNHLLTPMCVYNGQHFFVDEIALLQDGHLVIPKMWIKCNNELHGDGYQIVMQDVSQQFDKHTVQY